MQKVKVSDETISRSTDYSLLLHPYTYQNSLYHDLLYKRYLDRYTVLVSSNSCRSYTPILTDLRSLRYKSMLKTATSITNYQIHIITRITESKHAKKPLESLGID